MRKISCTYLLPFELLNLHSKGSENSRTNSNGGKLIFPLSTRKTDISTVYTRGQPTPSEKGHFTVTLGSAHSYSVTAAAVRSCQSTMWLCPNNPSLCLQKQEAAAQEPRQRQTTAGTPD